jgi:hypothetical protein
MTLAQVIKAHMSTYCAARTGKGVSVDVSIRMPPTLGELKFHHDIRHLVRPQMAPYEWWRIDILFRDKSDEV